MDLLEQIASYDNLQRAAKTCARGKRQSQGYQNFFANQGDHLVSIRRDLISASYSWSAHRKFIVHDPKSRTISAPIFKDRVTHTAICNYVEPVLDKELYNHVYACRKNRGNRRAVIDLLVALRNLGKNRFVVKLDVEKYFDSIDQGLLFGMLKIVLPDDSLNSLLQSLLSNYSSDKGAGKGLPIGSLTSQIFANFYLNGADKIASESLGVGFCFRYMDDFVLLGNDRAQVWEAAYKICHFVEEHLKLKLPFTKRHPLGNDPVPFLGFVVDEDGYRSLTRNKRRHIKRLRRLDKTDARESQKEQVRCSFAAWENLDPHLSRRLSEV